MMRSLFGLIFGSARNASTLGDGVRGVAEVFRPNATRAMELGHDAYMAAHATHGAEFQHARTGWFDAFVNGLNRLPRPMLALGTLALFIYAMHDPVGFAVRMDGLATVPEPLWWLLGAVVAFYFGARESHHLRHGWQVTRAIVPLSAAMSDAAPAVYDIGSDPRPDRGGDAASTAQSARPEIEFKPEFEPVAARSGAKDAFRDNAALRDWRASRER